ncbi:hypothetical protein M422DRAFT_241126 [Sphaerobolus stellatus SS14]|nr:hypothetical protein M422DRAFT_241126 [Sphaerobolus stellatus SS14]
MDTPTTGVVDFVVGEKTTYQTWYTIFGDIKGRDCTPLVAVHGGPGLSHDYMLPNAELFEKAKIPVVLYDQLGCGRSSHIPDAPQSFWTAELLMDELHNILDCLGISSNFDLLGHSWGGTLAADYAARQPPGLRRLIIANAPASMKLLFEGIAKILEDRYTPEFGAMLQRHEDEGTLDEQEYKDGKTLFSKRHICTLDPWPKQLLASFSEHEKDPSPHKALWGDYLLKMTGNLRDLDLVPILDKISCPTLLLHSPTDEVHEISVLPFFQKIPKIKWAEFTNSSHLAQFEESDRYFEVVIEFLAN